MLIASEQFKQKEIMEILDMTYLISNCLLSGDDIRLLFAKDTND